MYIITFFMKNQVNDVAAYEKHYVKPQAVTGFLFFICIIRREFLTIGTMGLF